MTSSGAIEVRQLSFQYSHDVDVLSGATLRVEPGEVVGVLGLNGAGKTTLFRSVAGFSLPRERRRASQRLGWVPDEPLLYAKLSALENMNRFALLWGVQAEQAKRRSQDWLEATELWSDRHRLVEEYSRGMRQRLAIGCALLHEPSVVVMDEPFNGLDIKSALWLRELLRQRAASGVALLVSSHQPEALDAIVDRLALLDRGRIQSTLNRAELLACGGTEQVFRASEARRAAPEP